jgi:hypothetical protein
MLERYRVDVQVQQSDIWELVCYTNDVSKAERYVDVMLRSEEVQAARVVDQETGQIVIYERS